jgi:hypothetical protein
MVDQMLKIRIAVEGSRAVGAGRESDVSLPAEVEEPAQTRLMSHQTMTEAHQSEPQADGSSRRP